MRAILLVFLILISFPVFAQSSEHKKVKSQLTIEEEKLYTLLMDYRKANNLPDIPRSNSLTFVAQTHCRDLANNKPDAVGTCNMHSWSDKGNWTGCCYTGDHKRARCMWEKPRELTSYPGTGYEIAFKASSAVTAEDALNGWKSSRFHNDVVLNKDLWQRRRWNAVGIGIFQNYAVVWFGEEVDESGAPTTAEAE